VYNFLAVLIMRCKHLPLALLILITSLIKANNADSLLTVIGKTENALDKAEAYFELAKIVEGSQPTLALEYLKTGFDLANSVSLSTSRKSLSPEADILKVKCLRFIGIIHSNMANYDEALNIYFEVKAILDNLKTLYTSPFDNEIQLINGKLLNNIGVVYSRQGVFRIAKEYYAQALEQNILLNDTIAIAVAYSSMGIVEARMANFTEALSFFQKALEFYLIKNDQDGIAQAYNNVGGIHFQTNNWNEALVLYTKAHDMYLTMNSLQRAAAVKSNIGMVHQKLGTFNTSMEYMLEALAMRTAINDKAGMVESFNNIGGLNSEIGNHTLAKEYYYKALDLATAIGDNRIKALSQINIGKVFFNNAQYANAIASTLKGLETSQTYEMKSTVQMAMKQLAEFYAATGDYKNGYKYSREFFDITQEIMDEQKARQLKELEIEYKAREKQQRIEALEQESLLQLAEIKQSRILSWILGLLFLSGIILTVFIFLLHKQRSRILVLQKENEAEKVIRKTDNNLQAILKTHAHGMILFDSELTVLSFNEKAANWFLRFTENSLSALQPITGIDHRVIKHISSNNLLDALKGYSSESEHEVIYKDQKYYYKFFCNPVFENDSDMIQSVSLMIEDVSDIRQHEERILADLNEKEALVHEIHHRVKNNLQVIISLIRMQGRQFNEPKLQEAFRDLEQRIATMSYVHEDIYKSTNLAAIPLNDYIEKISATLSGLYRGKARVYSHLELQNNLLNIDMAMPCGMLINELVTNSLKHAFTNGDSKNNRIDIHLVENPLNYELRVVDNGSGLKEGINPARLSSMGFHLVKVIVEDQLFGSWNIHSNTGVKVSIVFPKNKPELS
jgi:two-component sensor histidine kinase/Tfp pilus assembly protein PilF